MRVSIVQSSLQWENPAANIKYFEDKIVEVAPNSDLIVLPEMFTTGFCMNPEKMAEEHPGKTVQWITCMAANNKVAITGSYIAKENGKYYNRMLFAFPNGNVEHYDKRHLFRMGEEDKHYTPGSKRVIVSYLGWRILLLVCYDLRFPVWSRNQNNYDLIVLVANFPESRRFAWNTLLLARAMENQCYVAACNRIGADGNSINHSGDSQIIDPLGHVLAIASPNNEEVLTSTLSLEYLINAREKFPVHLDSDNFKIL
ncbi:MAG: amidohydrolase [Bacteroidales bacterium]